MSTSESRLIATGSVRSAGGGPLTVGALGPSPRPWSPWQLAHCSRYTWAPRAGEGGRVGSGTIAPPAVRAMRSATSLATRSTESAAAAAANNATRRPSPESAAARAARGRNGTSKRACSRNWRASSTSAADVTCPGGPGTPTRYSLAASATAATTRRAADNESVACPASGAATQTTNDRPKWSLRRIRVVLKEDGANTRAVLMGIQATAYVVCCAASLLRTQSGRFPGLHDAGHVEE